MTTCRLRIARCSAALVLLLASCAAPPAPLATGTGPDPALPPPSRALLPTVNIAVAEGWADGQMPRPAPGLAVTAFATGLDHPRWLYELPNGDVLVAEANAPSRPDDAPGLRGFVMRRIMAAAGAGVPSADRITLLRDADGDGTAETRTTFLAGLTSPIGMALVRGRLYIANTDAIVSVPYRDGMTAATETPRRLAALPAGPINHHWTKTLTASPDGRTLYAGIGSNSNVAENGIGAETGRAAIWAIDIATGTARPYATGLRNPVGLDIDRRSGKLWAVVNERDELGHNLVPDYLTAVTDGAFYGWPYSYYGTRVDARVAPARPDLVARATVPDYALGSHVAPLGLDIAEGRGTGMAGRFGRGAFIGEHGSWNRRPRSGYEVVFVPFSGGRPQARPETVLSGFLDGDASRGRPAGVLLDLRGGLLVADDVGNRVWRVTIAPDLPRR